MRILIGFDGTEASMDAVNDLRHSGLPSSTEAIVFTVAEAWDHLPDENTARRTMDEGTRAVKELFPNWNVTGMVSKGCPADEILAFSEKCVPDLVVVGEPVITDHDRGFFLGQNTQKLLTDADCSIRVSRPASSNFGDPERILVGFDGSKTSLNAIETIITRTWPAGAKVRLIVVADSAVLQAIGRFTPQMTDAVIEERLVHQWANSLAAPMIQRMANVGIEAEVVVRFGSPKAVLPEEARSWKADSIFVGPHTAPNSFARFLIGSVSSAVAARANCSVEVVREKHSDNTN